MNEVEKRRGGERGLRRDLPRFFFEAPASFPSDCLPAGILSQPELGPAKDKLRPPKTATHNREAEEGSGDLVLSGQDYSV